MIFISSTLYLYFSHDKGDSYLIWYGECFSVCSHHYHLECGLDFQGVSGWIELAVELNHSAHHLGKEGHVPYHISVHVVSLTEIFCFCLCSAPASCTSIFSKENTQPGIYCSCKFVSNFNLPALLFTYLVLISFNHPNFIFLAGNLDS